MTEESSPGLDLVAEVLAEPSGQPGTTCGVIRLERRDPELGRQVRAAIAASRDHQATARVFSRHNIDISRLVISKHAAGMCISCQRLTS